MPTTTVMDLPYPQGSDDADVPADMGALAARLDATPGVESLTSAQIAALSAPQRPPGRVVHNSTTGLLMVSTGASFVDVTDPSKLPLAGGTMTGPVAMGGSKITGLAAGTANGDAVRFEQLSPIWAVGIAESSVSHAAGQWRNVAYMGEADPSGILDPASGSATLTSGIWVVSGTTVFMSGSEDSTSAWHTRLRQDDVTVAQQTVGYTDSIYARAACVSAVLVVAGAGSVKMQVYVGKPSGSSTMEFARLSIARIGN